MNQVKALFMLFLITLCNASSAFENNCKVDIYGTSLSNGTKIIDQYCDKIGSYVEALKQGLDQKDDEAIEKAKATHDEIIYQLKTNDDFSFVELSTFFYFDGYFTTIDVVEKKDIQRLHYFKSHNLKSINTIDYIFEFWSEHNAEVFQSFITGRIDIKGSNLNEIYFPKEVNEEFNKFLKDIDSSQEILIETLLMDENPSKRAAAAMILSFVDKPRFKVQDLLPSIYDPDRSVRNNVMRTISVLVKNNEPNNFPIEMLVDALDFPYATDRNKALIILSELSDYKYYHNQILKSTSAALIHNLRLKQPNLHDTAYAVLRKISQKNYSEFDIDAWEDYVKKVS